MSGGGAPDPTLPGGAEQIRKNTLTNTSFNSLFSQMKILKKGSITASTTPTVIPHGYSGIPYVRIWAEQISGEIDVPVLVAAYTAYHSRYSSVPNVLYYIDSTNVTIYTSSSTATVWYRIYAL